MNEQCWSVPSTVRWPTLVLSVNSTRVVLIRPLPPSVSDLRRDCICLQTCLRRWVVWAGGSWQELQAVALALPATNTWTSKSSHTVATGNQHLDRRSAALFAAVAGLFPRPHSVKGDSPPSHYHLPNVLARGGDLNIHSTLTHNRHISSSTHIYISATFCLLYVFHLFLGFL